MIQIGMKNFYNISETEGNARLAKFMTVHHAIERSALTEFGSMKADITVDPEQITYYIGAGNEQFFVLTITGEPDEEFLIHCDRVQRSREELLLTHQLETDIEAAEEAIFEIAAVVTMTDE